MSNHIIYQTILTRTFSSEFKVNTDGGMYKGFFSIFKSLLQGIFSTTERAGVYASAIALIVTIIFLIWSSRKPQQLAEAKVLLGKKGVIVCLLFGVTALVSLVASMSP